MSRLALTAVLAAIAGCVSPAAPRSAVTEETIKVTYREAEANEDELDEEEPTAPPHPRVDVFITYAPGNYDHDTDGSNLDDDTDAGLFRIRAEAFGPAGVGGGVALEFAGTDDDLFEDQGALDGEVSAFDVFPFLVIRVAPTPRFRLPIRLGPYFQALQLEDDTSAEITWASVGARIEVAPEVVLIRENDLELSLFGEFGAGVQDIHVDVDSVLLDESYDSDGYTYGIQAGLRLRVHILSLGISYLQRNIEFDDSDIEFGTRVRGVDARFQGLAFELGFRF